MIFCLAKGAESELQGLPISQYAGIDWFVPFGSTPKLNSSAKRHLPVDVGLKALIAAAADFTVLGNRNKRIYNK